VDRCLDSVDYPRILHGMKLKRPTLVQATSYCLFLNLAIVLHLAQLPVWFGPATYHAESANAMRLGTSGQPVS
jgi:hypothetical protein